jgi:FLVCR family feline leukemia virus subgroup C receptor-related protein
LKKDRNLWKFFGSYSLFYGSFLIFGGSANFLIKPFGFADLSISIAAVGLILFGTVGAIIGSIFIKKTGKYKLLITITTFTASGMLAVMVFQLLILPAAGLTMLVVAVIGLFVVPVVPASYEIGCEVAFPIGEAQVTGILNGGALLCAFVLDSIMTAAIGFGTKERTTVFIMFLFFFLSGGSYIYYKTEIILKRKEF